MAAVTAFPSFRVRIIASVSNCLSTRCSSDSTNVPVLSYAVNGTKVLCLGTRGSQDRAVTLSLRPQLLTPYRIVRMEGEKEGGYLKTGVRD